MFRNFNFNIFSAIDGLDALNMVKENLNKCEKCSFFKTIIMDFNMPVMSGSEASVQILELLKQKKKVVGDAKRFDIIIIGYSAYTDADHINSALESGMVMVLNKPTQRDTFVDTFLQLGIL